MATRQGPNADDQERGRIRRGGKVGGIAARHALRSAAGAVKAPFQTDEVADVARTASILKLADDIVVVAGGMRGAAHKLGQLLGMLDLGLSSPQARRAFHDRLQPLFASAPRWDDAQMRAVVEKSLGKLAEQISPLEDAVAAASIGQVYRAKLSDGRTVAVKVKYPGIDWKVRADLRNLTLLVRVLGKYLSAANVDEIVAEVAQQISYELDFGRELANQSEFAERYRDHPVFRIPAPVPELCSADVMVTEFLDGAPFTDALAWTADRRNVLGEAIYRFYCGEMYRIGKFCGDPHPGNVLLLADGSVGFVDFGLCVGLTAGELEIERTVFRAVLDGDLNTAFRIAVDGGFIVDTVSIGPEEFGEYLRAVVGWHLEPGAVTVGPDQASSAAAAAVLPRGGYMAGMGSQRLLQAHTFGRRNELATCSMLGQLEATAEWSSIARECLGMSGPATSMGERVADWLAEGP